jgi:hypothetical protein
MNVSVSISTSNPHVGSLVQVYESIDEAAAGLTEFLRSAKRADEAEAAAPEEEPDAT